MEINNQNQEQNQPKTTLRPQNQVYKTPKYNCVHLKFLIDFLKATKTSVEDFAGSYSNSVVLRRQLKTDDMLLSKAKALFERNGYSLHVTMKEKNPNTENDDVDIVLDIPDIVEDPNTNIRFILDMLDYHGVNLNQIAEMIDVTPGAVWAWKRVDDIRISYLYRIKNALNCNMDFRITKG